MNKLRIGLPSIIASDDKYLQAIEKRLTVTRALLQRGGGKLEMKLSLTPPVAKALQEALRDYITKTERKAKADESTGSRNHAPAISAIEGCGGDIRQGTSGPLRGEPKNGLPVVGQPRSIPGNRPQTAPSCAEPFGLDCAPGQAAGMAQGTDHTPQIARLVAAFDAAAPFVVVACLAVFLIMAAATAHHYIITQ